MKLTLKDPPSARQMAFLLSLAAAVLLLLHPAPAMDAIGEALSLCTETLIPSLFPFLTVSSLLTALMPGPLLERLLSPLMGPLFHLTGRSAAVLLLGFTGGYPVGVRTAAALYRQGQLSRDDTERLLSFCNNSGPGFLLGVVGIGVFGSSRAGLLLYAIHIAAALLVGILFRFTSAKGNPAPRPPAVERPPLPLARQFTECVTGAFSAVLQICAFVLFFMVALRLLSLCGILPLCARALTALFSPCGMTGELATALLAGFLELSTGSACLMGCPLTPGTAALASFLLGWGGLSVHCQSLLFLLDTDLSCRPYFIGKLLQGLFSAGLTLLLFPLFL